MDFGTQLKNLRTARGLQQGQLADELGLSASAIGAYERGQREPTLALLTAIADYFQVSADVLLGRQPIPAASSAPQDARSAQLSRRTKETQIDLSLRLEKGASSIETGIGFFDHMLTALAFYGGMQLDLNVKGDLHVDGHHTVEDVGIVLGQAFRQALGDKVGIQRFASSFVPMDEALCRCALDVSGRPFLVFDAEMPQAIIGGYDSCLTVEFMRAFAMNAGVTLHLKCEYGANAHHITEGLFKALGFAIADAVRVVGSDVTSTKGAL
jgi:imidazoleglycerol-phosphate dehydratase